MKNSFFKLPEGTPPQAGIALRSGVIMLISLIPTVGLYFYLAVSMNAWQMFVAAGAVTMYIIVTLAAIWQARRGNYEWAGYALIYGLLAGLFTFNMAIQNFGLVLGIASTIIAFVIGRQLLPARSMRITTGLVVLVSAAMVVIDLVAVPAYRLQMQQLQVYIPVVLGLLVVILAILVLRQAWSGNIRVKIVTSFTVIALLSVAIVGTVVYFSYRNQVREDIRQRLLNIVTITAARLDGDMHATLQTPEDMQTEAYRQMMAEGDEIIATDPDLIFSYTMRLNEQGEIYFILDSRRADDTEREPIGTIYDEPSETLRNFFNAPDRPIVEKEIYTDQYGSVLSAFAPFYRADGSMEGVFGIDIAADAVLERERAVVYLILGTTLGTMILVTLIGLFLGNLLIRPIINLSMVAKKITVGDLSARARIETADEVGDLAKDFNLMTNQLQETLQGLERRVAERTRNLELAAEVGRTVSQVRALDIMLTDAAELIRKQFDLYYVQVYLADPASATLRLESGTGSVGEQLLARRHRLPIDTASINGRAAVEGRSVVIADTAASATFKPNPLLPETRSEMAVPLLIGTRVVGVLNMQSDRPGALSADILPAFEALAGQLAVAIQNAGLLAEAQEARREVEAQARHLSRANWVDYLDAIHKPEESGYVFDGNVVAPLGQAEAGTMEGALVAPIAVSGETLGSLVVELEGLPLTGQAAKLTDTVARLVAQRIEALRLLESAERYRAEAEEASRRLTHEGWQGYLEKQPGSALGYLYDLKEVRPYREEDITQLQGTTLDLPLKVREETVGRLAVQGIEDGDVEQAGMAAAVAERLSAHIEGLRLTQQTEQALSATRNQARREQALRQITSAVRGSTDPAVILRTAARELGGILGRRTIVRLETNPTPHDKPTAPEELPGADGGTQ